MPKEDDLDLLDETSRAFLQEPMKGTSYLLWTILAFFFIMFVWAYFAKLDERTIATGKVIPSSKVQNIQNLEGGIISQIDVTEGKLVDKGEVILKLDATRFIASYDESLVKYQADLAKLTRLEAENEDKETIVFPSELKQKYPELVANETKLFLANREGYFAANKLVTQNYENAKKQYEIAKPLAEEGVLSKMDLLKIEKDLNEAQNNIEVQKKTYKSKVNDEIVTTKADMDGVKKVLDGLQDKINRTIIHSPMKGIVKKLNFNTIGGVVQPGENLMEIVPIEDSLLIEAKIPPDKIAFIHPGQLADIKISAYDYSIYGSLTGTVKYVSADTIFEENESGKKETYFRTIIQTEQTYIIHGKEKLPIIPGMQVTASILTGKKTVLEYLLKPLIKAKEESFNER